MLPRGPLLLVLAVLVDESRSIVRGVLEASNTLLLLRLLLLPLLVTLLLLAAPVAALLVPLLLTSRLRDCVQWRRRLKARISRCRE